MEINDTDSLRNAIDNLSAKKHVLSNDAVKAKSQYDKHYAANMSPSDMGQFSKSANTISTFNDSVFLLVSIFKQSRFDELAQFISKPKHMIFYQFCLGIARGLGFCVAVLFFLYLLFYFSQDSLLPLLVQTL